MKKYGIMLFAFAMLAACKQSPSTGNFGATITGDGAVTVQEMLNQLGDKQETEAKITATVNQVCQKEGCWYTVQLPDGKDMMIMTKDHSFTLPKDCAGKTAIAEGRAYWKETSVEDLKHYAEDAGKSPEEIAAITEPKRELRFEAKGVIIEGEKPAESH